MTITWSESDNESEGETDNNVMTFTRKYEYEEDSCDEDMTKKELIAKLRLLYTKWDEACSIVKKHKDIISMLHKEKDNIVLTITGLEEEICMLNAKLESMPEVVLMMENSLDMLDDV